MDEPRRIQPGAAVQPAITALIAACRTVQVPYRHHDFARVAIGLGEELVDEFLKRRDYGETVRPALRVTVLDRLPGITESVVRRDLSGRTRHDSPCLPRTEIS